MADRLPTRPPRTNWGNLSKNLALWLLVGLLALALFQMMSRQHSPTQEFSYTEFSRQLDQGNVARVEVYDGKRLEGDFRNPVSQDGRSAKSFQVLLPVANSEAFIKRLEDAGVPILAKEPKGGITAIIIAALPWIVILGLWFFLLRQLQAGGSRAFAFGKSKAKLLAGDTPKITFADVAGADEAKQELQEIIEFLRDPQKFTRLGGRLPKGALLVGPPGTGKTLLARAGAGLGGGHDEREQTLNQLLVEMDGFESNDGVILIAATNRPDVLDPALLRPGRFDRRVVVSRPDVRGREGILQVHTRKIPLSEDVDISVLARATPGFSGAAVAIQEKEAALLADRHSQKFVTMRDFESSKDKVLMGAERKSMIITEEEKKITAYHEAGHALLAALLPHTDPLHKVTIIPRGMALGLTQQLPTEEKHNWSKEQLESRIAVCMGGRIAEELTFGQITTGAQNDIEQATEMARKMVCEWGMSETLGPLTYGKKEEAIFLGKEFNRHQDYSEATALKIDSEVKRIVSEHYERAMPILTEKRQFLLTVADGLLEHEVLDAEQVQEILAGQPMTVRVPPKPAAAPPPPREGKVDEGGRNPGILPPPMAAPKPTS